MIACEKLKVADVIRQIRIMIIVGGDDLSREYLEEIHSKLSEVALDIHMKVSHEARSILHRGIIDQRGDPMENIEGAGSQLLRVIAAHPPLLLTEV